MKKHRLERAIVLGLMLSTSIYGTSFAMDTKAETQETTTQTVTLDEFKNNELSSTKEPIDGVSKDNDAYNISKNIIIKGEYTTTTDKNGNIVYNVPQWWVNSPNEVYVKDNVNVVFDDVSLREPVITGNGNITINNSKTGNPIFVGANIQANNLVLNTNGGNGIYAYGHDVFLDVNNLEINSTANGIIQEANDNTKETDIYINDTDSINIHSSGSWAIHCNAISSNANDIYMQSDRENSIIKAMGANGVSNSSPNGGTFLKADNINIGAWSYYGVIAVSGKLDITAKNDIIIADDDTKKGDYATQAAEADSGMLTINAQNGSTTIIGNEGVFTNRKYKNGQIKITSKENNNILAKTHTLQATQEKIDDGNIIVTGKNNYIVADSNIVNQKFNPDFGNGLAISPENTSITKLTATDGGYNIIKGAIVIEKGASEVYIDGNDNEISSSYVDKNNNIVSSIYSKEGIVEFKGKNNQIYTNATDTQKEHVVWAQQGGKINIDGQTTIVASNADVNTNNIGGNSLGIAITAGTGDISGLEELPPLNTTQDGNEIRSTVNITNASGSSITGDIVSGYGGLINIGMDVSDKTRAAGTVENIKITGNALAANGGKLNINLGNGGTWTGRADDYGDAGYGPDEQNHQNFYNPAFSNDILEGGTVNLTMGDNSTWKVQGQSWITSVDTTNAQNATIDLVEANTDRNTTSHALTIYDLKGNANINMNLDGNRDVSDMLYIKKAEGEYNIALADAVTTADMYANGLNGLRFATVGAGSKVKFNAGSYDAGVFNVEYEVGTDAYDGNDENVVYNGDSLDVQKPGTSTVDSFFGYQGEDPNAEENTSGIATYARMAEEPQVMALAEEPATETTATTKEATATGATNYKLIARKGESLSDAGKTILNMSKANYSQAVYLDTLNKRLGEARYLEGDEGLWVRMRHDKIDKDSSYEITNNMYELGYDKKYESKDKNGYHRKGVAIDYMDGDTSYDDIAGSGETNRKGIWLYDTWIGNKGHYTDYVAKWGHLENSFDLYTKTRGEKVSGEYDNDVYSLSAEWGYKDQLNNDWYIEPQVQLQYARVTGADYETSQGTQVSVDGIDSLIARAGFRLGKDFGEEKKSTFYVKADILHEFLGDQDISVLDKTTDGKITSIGYDNDGTWYSVGLGFSTMLSDNSYAFLDVEKIFGNDNDNSYQINGGFNWLL